VHLLWCPINDRTHRAFHDDAKHTLFVQNERYQDSVILSGSFGAARARQEQ